MARKLDRYKVDIAALSETRFADKGKLRETGCGYAFLWSGRSSEERREACIPEGLNDLLVKMQLPLGQKTNAPLISAYTPTMTNRNEIKDRFYEELDSLIASVLKLERVIILGDSMHASALTTKTGIEPSENME